VKGSQIVVENGIQSYDYHSIALEVALAKALEGDVEDMGLWQGVATDSLKFHPGLPYPTLRRSSTTPHAVRLC
jgi:hypothetical protein